MMSPRLMGWTGNTQRLTGPKRWKRRGNGGERPVSGQRLLAPGRRGLAFIAKGAANLYGAGSARVQVVDLVVRAQSRQPTAVYPGTCPAKPSSRNFDGSMVTAGYVG